MSWVAVAIGGSAVIGAGASIYAADKSKVTPGAPLDPGKIGTDSLNTQANLAPQVLGLEQQYRGQYTNLANQNLNQALLGAPTFDAEAAFRANPWLFDNIKGEAAAQGLSPAQWLENHVREQGPKGDAFAASLLQQFTSNQGGMLDAYKTAVPQINDLQNQANTSTRTSTVNDAVALAPKLTEAFNAANPDRAKANNLLSTSMQGLNLTGSYNPISAGTLGPASQAGVTNAEAANARLYTANAQNATGGPLLGVLEADAQKALNAYSPIQSQLNAQASALLASGGALSPDEIRAIQQGSRGAAAARGIYDSNASIASEAMNTAAAQRARQLQNMQIAQGVDATGQQQINNSRTYAQGVQAQGQNLSTYNTGQQNQVGMFNAQAGNQNSQFNASNQTAVNLANAQAANQASQFNAGSNNQYGLAQFGANQNAAQFNAGMGLNYLQSDRNYALQGASQLNNNAYDPLGAIMGTGSNAIGQAGTMINQAGMNANTGPTIFDPFRSDIMGIYSGNQANNTAAGVANANNQAALWSAGIQGVGNAAGAYAAYKGAQGACWVARAVYGEHNPKWIVFREWLLTEAPGLLRRAYLRHGERFAAYIADKPVIKAAIRRMMDRVVNPRIANRSLQPA